MIQEKYIRENNMNIMSIELEEKFKDDFQLKMLINTKIDSFLPFIVNGVNNKYTLDYNISSKQPLSRVYEANLMDKESVYHVFRSMVQVIKSVSDYLLDLDHILLNPKFVYMDMSTKKFFFTYYPDSDRQFGEALKELFEFMLEHFDHTDKNAVIEIYNAYHKILQNSSDIESVIWEIIQKDFEPTKQINEEKTNDMEEGKLLDQVIPETVEYQEEGNSNRPKYIFLGIKGVLGVMIIAVITGVFFPQYSPLHLNVIAAVIAVIFLVTGIKVLDFVYKKYKPCFIKLKNHSDSIAYRVFKNEIEQNCNYNKVQRTEEYKENQNLQESNQTSEYIHTQLLSEFLEEKKNRAIGKLIFLEKSEEILVENLPFIIGSHSAYCNYVLDSRVISRMHLKITRDVGSNQILVEDLNSTNGTYLNQKKIEPGKGEKLEDGDCIGIGIFTLQFLKGLEA